MVDNINGIDDEQLAPSNQEIEDCVRALHRKYAPKPDMDEEWKNLQTRLANIEEEQHQHSSSRRKLLLLGFSLGVAAACLVFLVFRWQLKDNLAEEPFVAFKATSGNDDIVIQNGEQLTRLEKGASFDCRKLSRPTEKVEELVALSTPRGKDCTVTLSDGSTVHLNADSKIQFPREFQGSQRVVTLEGEAYFQVTKSPDKPFIVKSQYFTTLVHGTTFNMRAYSGSDASVVLIEGSVSVKDNQTSAIRSIRPGQKVQWQKGNGLAVSEVDTYPYEQWQQGFFYFDNARLYDIMQDLGHWYNVNIIFKDTRKMNLRLHFVADRNQSVDEAIRNLNDLNLVHVEHSGEDIIIY
jgi:transmembrane sensor